LRDAPIFVLTGGGLRKKELGDKSWRSGNSIESQGLGLRGKDLFAGIQTWPGGLNLAGKNPLKTAY